MTILLLNCNKIIKIVQHDVIEMYPFFCLMVGLLIRIDKLIAMTIQIDIV